MIIIQAKIKGTPASLHESLKKSDNKYVGSFSVASETYVHL